MQWSIIGGGYAGAALALALCRPDRASTRGFDLTWVDPEPNLGAGAAYATPFASHLLNVRRAQMGAVLPAQFDAWLQQNAPEIDSDFLPRRLYGRYLQATVAELLGNTPHLRHIRARASRIAPHADRAGASVHLDNGVSFEAQRICLCLGNSSARPPNIPGLRDLPPTHGLLDPWKWQLLDQLPDAGHVFILGTGLTMVDIVLALRERGFTGRITAMSRHGLRPQAHMAEASPLPNAVAEPPSDVRTLVRVVREAAGGSSDWRHAVDSLRSVTPALWQALSPTDRQSFLRHVKPYWDVHRHRIAPEVDAQIHAMLQDETLDVRAGRLREIKPVGRQLSLRLRPRHQSHEEMLRADFLVNCTGQDNDWRQPSSPLLQQMQADGLYLPDAMGLGVQADAAGALLQRDGACSSTLFVTGSSLTGRDLESVAVPELRQQAERVAQRWCR